MCNTYYWKWPIPTYDWINKQRIYIYREREREREDHPSLPTVYASVKSVYLPAYLSVITFHWIIYSHSNLLIGSFNQGNHQFYLKLPVHIITMVDRKLGLCYGSIELFNTMLHNLFLLYHVETFVAIYKIDKMSFWIGEAVFLLWNSLNDPLFGWLSDRKYLHSNDAENDVVMRRLNSLRLFGPLFGISFLSFWVSWLVPSLQFVICLCLYDSFLTMIDLHHSALLADLAVSGEVRTRLNAYCSVFGAAGALSVFMSYAVWNRSDMFEFQVSPAYHQVSNIRRTKSQPSKYSHTVLRLSLPNTLKPDVESKMKM